MTMKTCGAALAVMMLAAAVAGCSGSDGLSGTYVPAGRAESMMEALEFVSRDTVDLRMITGTTRAAYKRDGQKLIVTSGGQSLVASIDDKGCLDFGLQGRFCKKA